jgi:hypothetical protein
LQRFLFLRQAWKSVLSENDTSWIDEEIAMAERYPTGPYAGTGTALKDCLAKGVERQGLVDIVRGAQAQLLFQLCYLLDDPNIEVPELVDMSWGLFQTDDDGNPVGSPIQSLHESVLETDPTGREMRPRGDVNA